MSLDVHVDWGLTPDCPESGRVVSFGEGGCFIRTAGEVPPGARVFVSLWLPTGLREGEVRHRVEDVGFGVEFKRGARPTLNAADTRDLRQPPSVTESTTALLDPIPAKKGGREG